MNKFVTTALGLAAVGSVGMADPGDNEWLGLDSEINHLARSLTPAQDGMGWSFLMRIAYVYSSDDIATDNVTGATFGGEDISGFDFNDLDLAFWGSVGDFGWRLRLATEHGPRRRGVVSAKRRFRHRFKRSPFSSRRLGPPRGSVHRNVGRPI